MSDPLASAPPMEEVMPLSAEPIVKDDEFLEPVPPFFESQGFPYAPTDWPNHGDVWGWKVGKRISSYGYYTDRFLIPPRSLQKPSCPRHFASRRSLELYILKEFPDADIDAFFGSFIWRIPSTLWHSKKVRADSLSLNNVEEDRKAKTPVTVKRRMKHTAAASSAKRQTRHSGRLSITGSAEGMKNTSGAEDDQPGSDLIEGNGSHLKCMPENFHSFIDFMDDILAQPLAGASVDHAATNSSTQEEELAEAQILEEKKAKALSLKEEYNEIKEKAAQLQTEIDSDLLPVKEINDQIAKLQSERGELMKKIEIKKKTAVKLRNAQKKVVHAIQNIVFEVQLANSKRLKMEADEGKCG